MTRTGPGFFRQVVGRVDQVAVMIYDSGLPLGLAGVHRGLDILKSPLPRSLI